MASFDLDRIVEAVSDGEPIDWDSVRRRLTDPETRDYCAHLETLWKIGRVRAEQEVSHKGGAESAWVVILLAITLLQILLGLAGSAVYRVYSFPNALRVMTVLSFAGVGIVLRLARDNARARDLGVVFLLSALGFSRSPYVALFDNWFGTRPALSVFRTGLAADAWAPFFIWQFARRFPATNRFTRLDRAALTFSQIAKGLGTLLFLVNVWTSIVHPQAGLVRTFALDYEEGQRFSTTTFALTLPALAVVLIRSRAAAADERARVRLFAWALAAGNAPGYLEVLLETFFPAYTSFLRGSSSALAVVVTAVILPSLTIPFVTGYSVLVHRLLDVRVVVKLGVQYLLARWILLALTLTPFVFLASYVYERRNDRVVDVVAGSRSVILLTLVLLGAALLAAKPSLLRLLDRWFDRRATDRTAVLAESGMALRLARTRSELVACLGEAAESALNASATAYFFDPGQHAYVPAGRGGLSLSGNSALATIMTQEPTVSALRTGGDPTIARFLPHAERFWLEDAKASVVAPIRSTGVERPTGMIAFGPRRDAMGYSREDERFVAALASAAGIAFENLRLKTEAVGDDEDDKFGTLCLRCRRVTDYVDGQVACPCGGSLQPASVPRRINGKFLVEGLLGTGGMGVAYLASDMALDRHVAIKTLPAVSPDAMVRLAREARTMASLSHPNLATILGYESWRGTPILVCEYLPGGTLQQQLGRGPMSVDEAVSLGLTLLGALGYMHAQGVLHRDIKPSNIAFTRDKTPKLLDFGLAGLVERVHSPASESGFALAGMLSTKPAGTVAYLPPQAFRGEPPTMAFDLWAIAVVLFEAIVGHHPFAQGDNTAENICSGRFMTADRERAVPPAVLAFLRRALRAGNHPPFESSSEMRDALGETSLALNAERTFHAP